MLVGPVRFDIPSNSISILSRFQVGVFGPLAIVFLSSLPVSSPSLILNTPFFAQIMRPFEANLRLLGYMIPVVRVVSMDMVAFAVFQNTICSLFGSARASTLPVPAILLSHPNSVLSGLPACPHRTQLPRIRIDPEYTLRPSGAML